jgi:hypothetical protein
MRRVKFMIPAVGATVFMVTGLVAPAGAASPPVGEPQVAG